MLVITLGASYRSKPGDNEISGLVYQVAPLRLIGLVTVRVKGLYRVILWFILK